MIALLDVDARTINVILEVVRDCGALDLVIIVIRNFIFQSTI